MDLNSIFSQLSDDEREQVTAIISRKIPKIMEEAVNEVAPQSESGQEILRQEFLTELKSIRPGDMFNLTKLMNAYHRRGLKNTTPQA